MNHLHNIRSELQRLESELADQIAGLARLLRPLSLDRDVAALQAQYRTVTLSRRALSQFVKGELQSVSQRRSAHPSEKRQSHGLHKTLSSVQKRLRVWGRFDTAVTQMIAADPCDLLQDHRPGGSGVEVMDHVVARCLDALHKAANPIAHTQSDDAEDRGLHRDIPLSMMQFSKMIGAAYRLCLTQRKAGSMRFLDVGSGGGTKVLAASTCFDVCHGLEYEGATVETGQALLNLVAQDTCTLIHGDALTYSGYAEYDVIYFYRPLVSESGMIDLETRILEQVRPGTILLAAGRPLVSERAEQTARAVVPSVYVAGVSEPDAELLRQNAERMGTAIPGHDRRTLLNPGYWAPLKEVCAENGYQV
ncbi:MAG: hypothetical protein AB3N17_09675 [Tateyamaria sp.]